MGKTNTESLALTCGLAAVLLWSTVATGFKLGLAILEVEQLLLLGSVLSWGVFALAAAFQGGYRIGRREILPVVMLGIINPFAYYLILFEAYDRLPAHIAQPINYTWAITLALLAIPILKQKLTLKTSSGILLAYAGVVLLVQTADSTEALPIDVAGIALALGSTVLWAVYWLVNTRLNQSRSSPPALMFWSFSVGLPLIAVVCWFGPGFPQLTSQTITYGAWVGLIEMGITFLLWQRALALTQHVARIGALIFLSPFASLVLIYFVLGEQISPWAIVALLVIVAGVMLSQPRQVTTS